jgi:RND superfamily putative drug exporter
MLARIGTWCFSNPWKALAGWIVGIVAVMGVSGAIGPAFNDAFETPDSETARGFAVLEEHFPGQAGGVNFGSVVFQAEQGIADPAVQEVMEEFFAEIEAKGDAGDYSVVSPYSPFGAQQVNGSGNVAYATVNIAPSVNGTEAGEVGAELFAERPQLDGLNVEIGGAALGGFEPPETELIGLAFAIVILIVSFGSVLAMGMPIGVAIAGVGVGIGLLTLLSNVINMPDFAPTIAIMIGLGVGIDYALFIVTRYREEARQNGGDRAGAMFIAMDTAGRAVLFAGLTVVVSLLGMLLIGLPFMTGMGIGASVAVLMTMLAAITLLPALLGFAGDRIEMTRWRGLLAAGLVALALLFVGFGQAQIAAFPLFAAVAVLVVGYFVPFLKTFVPERREKPIRPWVALLAGSAILLALAAPVLGIRFGFSDEGNFPEDTTTRRAYDLVAEGFGPGSNGPMLVAITVDSPADAAALEPLQAAIAGTDGVAFVSPPFPSNVDAPEQSEAFLMQLVATTSPQAEETEDLVKFLRSDVVPAAVEGTGLDVNITGGVPASIDFSSYMASRTLVFFAAVLSLSFLLLAMVFRSLLVPLKAVIMNMLSIASAYGVVVAIFQWGWFGGLTGIEPAPIEPFLPVMLFAIVFGLSMDYEVFLLSRVKEEFDRTGDAVNSVADGLASTARVISAAAAIMVVVFGSFLFEDLRIIKLFGTGLALAVFLDATFVRMLLVPATMELLGEKNWWLPGWLDKILPRINVEGPAHPSASAADERELVNA